MSNPNPTHSTVKHTPLNVHKASAGLDALQAILVAGASSPDVQNSPLAKQAFTDLQGAVGALGTSLTNKLNLATALMAAVKALKVDFLAAEVAERTYEAAVNSIAKGDAAVITKAGLQARAQKTPPAALGTVKDLRSKPGKEVKQSILTWPEVAGATSYAVQVNFTPGNPTGPYTAIGSGSSRRRVVTAPAQGAQFLAQVAAIASDGTQSAWCEPILATAK
jgi:hypothetical protein